MRMVKVIPCLDFKDGKVVKGVGFTGLKEVGDPVSFAKKYRDAGADELVFLDISATVKGRDTAAGYVKEIAQAIDIPLTVGGGIKSIEDMERLFALGASKVSVNSAAVKNPNLVSEASAKFGKDRIVIAIDAARSGDSWTVLTYAGEKDEGLDVVAWAKEVEERGAGAILVTSKDFDGAQKGYDLELLGALKQAVNIPVIASGGAGNLEDFKAGVEAGADAVLAASVFHFDQISVRELKEYLAANGIPVSAKGLEPAFNSDGLVPAIAVDYLDNRVLMQAYMNKEAWEKTLQTKRATYFSRSRKKLWVKGEESGNIQLVKDIALDCDRDCVLLYVEQKGPACHTGNETCFYTRLCGEDGTIGEALTMVSRTVRNRKENPKSGSYTNYLFDQGIDKILKKVGEETAEVIIAAKNNSSSELIYEVADLMYHLSVLLEERQLTWQDIAAELKGRAR